MLINNSNQKYIIADFETCNLNLFSLDNKPWQLSFLIAQNNKILEIKDYYLWWKDLKISEDAKRITRFDYKKYKEKAVDPKPILEELDDYCYSKDCIVCGHNFLGFDVYIHMIYRQLLDKKIDYSYLNEDRFIDTSCLQKAIIKGIDFNDSKRITWLFKLNSLIEKGLKTNLAACCKYFDIEFDSNKLHDAKYDIEQNYKVFKKQIWKLNL